MKQVLFDGKGKLLIKDVPAPAPPANGALVRVSYSLISSGTESTTAAGGGSLLKKALAQPQLVVRAAQMAAREGLNVTAQTVRDVAGDWLEVGYSAAGTIVEIGPQTESLRVGQRVACSGAGYANHADFIAVPANLITPLPDNVTFQQGAFATLGAIALQSVRRAEITLGETVVVVGLGLIGQLVAQILDAAGCHVIGSDPVAERRALATELASAKTIDPTVGDPARAVMSLTNGQGADVVILAAATTSSEPVNQAFRMCRERGRVVMLGAMGMDLDRTEFYNRELDFVMSRAYGPGRYDRSYEEDGVDYPIGHVRWTEGRNLQAFVELVSHGKLNVDTLITADFPIEQAAEAYAHAIDGGAGALAAMLSYGTGEAAPATPQRTLRLKSDDDPSGTGRIQLAIIGAGSFTRAVHLPNLKASPLFDVRAIVGRSGSGAQRAANDASAAYATTDSDEVLNDPQVEAVLIGTRHHLHAQQAIAAAQAGKHIFVEKPLGLTIEECDAVLNAVSEAGVLLTVGLNRPLAPASQLLKQAVDGSIGPKMMVYRVNAGALPPTNWVLDPAIGGGRMVGEGCHFFDYLCWLVGSNPVSLTAQALSASPDVPPQDFTVSLTFPDGSIGTLVYTSLGNTSTGKDRLEVFAGGGIATLDDFREVTFKGMPGRSSRLKSGQKGYQELLDNFGAAIRGQAPLQVTGRSGWRATYIAQKAMQAIQTGTTVALDIPAQE